MTPPAVRQTQRLPTSSLSMIKWLTEVITGVTARPMRVALTILGTVLGTATLVAVLGLTASAQGQVSDRFSVLRATEVSVSPVSAISGAGTFPDDADQRVERLNGVNSAGVVWPVASLAWDAVSTTVVPGKLAPPPSGVTVFAATPRLVEASKGTLSQGRGFDSFCVEQRCQVVILGSVAAQRLGIGQIMPDQSIFIDGIPFRVVGILDDVSRNTQLLGGVIVPSTTALEMWGAPGQDHPSWMTIDTRIGAAAVVGDQVRYVLNPANPTAFEVVLPPDPRNLQGGVGGDLNTLFLALAGITLLVGAFGIANLSTVAVIERVPEIGLRRALGARPVHIAAQFVGESTCLGLIGGLFGTPVGIFVVLIVCLLKEWTALFPPWLMLTPLLGLVVGFLAGLLPAIRAARVEPVTALQR